MDFLVGFVFLFTVFVFLLLLGIHLKTRNQGKFLFTKLHHIPDFNLSQFIMGQQNSFLLAVDKEKELIAYILPNSQLVFPYSSVIKLELLKDNLVVSERVTSRSKNSKEIKEVLLREPHTLGMGELKSKEKEQVSRITIRLTLLEGENPWLPIYCFDAKSQLFGGSRTLDLTNKESQMYRKGLEIAYHLDMLFGKIIDRVDEEHLKNIVLDDVEKEELSVSIPKLIADELEKLFLLKEKGALTAEEFKDRKKKLLEL